MEETVKHEKQDEIGPTGETAGDYEFEKGFSALAETVSAREMLGEQMANFKI
jgi:hypothetical protein